VVERDVVFGRNGIGSWFVGYYVKMVLELMMKVRMRMRMSKNLG
jgi:hypothetical protein